MLYISSSLLFIFWSYLQPFSSVLVSTLVIFNKPPFDPGLEISLVTFSPPFGEGGFPLKYLRPEGKRSGPFYLYSYPVPALVCPPSRPPPPPSRLPPLYGVFSVLRAPCCYRPARLFQSFPLGFFSFPSTVFPPPPLSVHHSALLNALLMKPLFNQYRTW